MSQGQLCAECGNLFYGRECDLCGPMAATFERLKQDSKARSGERGVRNKQKPEKRDWEAGQDRALPPEKD